MTPQLQRAYQASVKNKPEGPSLGETIDSTTDCSVSVTDFSQLLRVASSNLA